jgi:putative oxidoreductase
VPALRHEGAYRDIFQSGSKQAQYPWIIIHSERTYLPSQQSPAEGNTSMIDTRTAPYAALVLRLALGVLFVAHVGLKVFVFTPTGTAQFFGSLGLPPVLAYVVIAWEFLGGLALILGVWPRIAALVLIPDLLGAIVTVHGAAGFFFDNAHGGWEYPALWIVGLAAVALIGDGPFALKATPVLASTSNLATAR